MSACISSVSDQNGLSLQWYIVKIHHSGWKPWIWTIITEQTSIVWQNWPGILLTELNSHCIRLTKLTWNFADRTKQFLYGLTELTWHFLDKFPHGSVDPARRWVFCRVAQSLLPHVRIDDLQCHISVTIATPWIITLFSVSPMTINEHKLPTLSAMIITKLLVQWSYWACNCEFIVYENESL